MSQTDTLSEQLHQDDGDDLGGTATPLSSNHTKKHPGIIDAAGPASNTDGERMALPGDLDTDAPPTVAPVGDLGLLHDDALQDNKSPSVKQHPTDGLADDSRGGVPSLMMGSHIDSAPPTVVPAGPSGMLDDAALRGGHLATAGQPIDDLAGGDNMANGLAGGDNMASHPGTLSHITL